MVAIAAGDTTENLVQWGAAMLEEAGIEKPRFEAQLLLAHALHTQRAEVLCHPRRVVPTAEALSYQELVRHRARRMPLAYLRGYQEFYGLTLEVTPATLIPRPETELVVQVALERLATRSNPVLVDACTGCGCIAIACAVHLRGLVAIASDISPDALSVAWRNCQRHLVGDRVALVAGDALEMLGNEVADVVTANPPYIASAEVQTLQPEIQYEPRRAVDGGPDGMSVLRRIVAGGRRVLRSGGMLVTEVAAGQAADVVGLMEHAGYCRVQALADLAGILRVVMGMRTG